MAISTMDGVVAALASGQRLRFIKTTPALEAAGVWASLWTAAGVPAAGAAQGTLNGANCDRTTTGGWSFANAGGSNVLYALQAMAVAMGGPGTLMLMDKVWHNSTMSGTATGTNSITQPSLPARITDAGLALRLGLEVFTSWGTTAVTCTFTYRDSVDDVDRTTTVGTVVPGGSGAPAASTFVELPMANGLGCKYAKSYGWSSTTGTAGNFGLVLYRPIALVQVAAAGCSVVHDFAGLGMPDMLNDACLMMCWNSSATASTTVFGQLVLGQG